MIDYKTWGGEDIDELWCGRKPGSTRESFSWPVCRAQFDFRLIFSLDFYRKCVIVEAWRECIQSDSPTNCGPLEP